MNTLQYILTGVTIVVLAALFVVGRKPDRLGVIAFVIVNWGSQFLAPLEIGNIRWAVALLSVTFLCALIALVAASRRWWIVAAAGFQLVSTASYGVAMADPDFLIWTGVSLRLGIWMLQLAACGFGIAEALSQRRAGQTSVSSFSTEYNR